jgi:hypothetical protein
MRQSDMPGVQGRVRSGDAIRCPPVSNFGNPWRELFGGQGGRVFFKMGQTSDRRCGSLLLPVRTSQ